MRTIKDHSQQSLHDSWCNGTRLQDSHYFLTAGFSEAFSLGGLGISLVFFSVDFGDAVAIVGGPCPGVGRGGSVTAFSFFTIPSTFV